MTTVHQEGAAPLPEKPELGRVASTRAFFEALAKTPDEVKGKEGGRDVRQSLPLKQASPEKKISTIDKENMSSSSTTTATTKPHAARPQLPPALAKRMQAVAEQRRVIAPQTGRSLPPIPQVLHATPADKLPPMPPSKPQVLHATPADKLPPMPPSKPQVLHATPADKLPPMPPSKPQVLHATPADKLPPMPPSKPQVLHATPADKLPPMPPSKPQVLHATPADKLPPPPPSTPPPPLPDSLARSRSASAPNPTTKPLADIEPQRTRATSAPGSPKTTQEEFVRGQFQGTEGSSGAQLDRAVKQMERMQQILKAKGKKEPLLDSMTKAYRDLHGLSKRLEFKFIQASRSNNPDEELAKIYSSRDFKEYARLSKEVALRYNKLLEFNASFSKKYSKDAQKDLIFNPSQAPADTFSGVPADNMIAAIQRMPRHILLLKELIEAKEKEGKQKLPEDHPLKQADKIVKDASQATQDVQVQRDLEVVTKQIKEFISRAKEMLKENDTDKLLKHLHSITSMLGTKGVPEDIKEGLQMTKNLLTHRRTELLQKEANKVLAKIETALKDNDKKALTKLLPQVDNYARNLALGEELVTRFKQLQKDIPPKITE